MTVQPHILVVDDHAKIRQLVSSYLEKNSMPATAAVNTVEMGVFSAKMVDKRRELIYQCWSFN